MSPQCDNCSAHVSARYYRVRSGNDGESEPLDTDYGLFDVRHFGDVDSFEHCDPQNPILAPDGLCIETQGEAPIEFVVDVEPEIRCDGRRSPNGVRPDHRTTRAQRTSAAKLLDPHILAASWANRASVCTFERRLFPGPSTHRTLY